MARTKYWGPRATLSLDEVLRIRRQLARSQLGRRDFGAMEPINPNNLASAVARQDTGFGDNYKYQRPHEVAATLFYGIAMNHAFENGNKRTALVSALVSLDRNMLDLCDTSQQDLYEMATTLAAGELPLVGNMTRSADAEVTALASWFRARVRKQQVSGDRAVQFKELHEILAAQRCVFEDPTKNFIRISLGGRTVKTGYPRADFTVGVGEVKRIREALGLAQMWSSDFYDLERRVDDFVVEHQDVLWRLANA
jgi:death-on-curing family protein